MLFHFLIFNNIIGIMLPWYFILLTLVTVFVPMPSHVVHVNGLPVPGVGADGLLESIHCILYAILHARSVEKLGVGRKTSHMNRELSKDSRTKRHKTGGSQSPKYMGRANNERAHD